VEDKGRCHNREKYLSVPVPHIVPAGLGSVLFGYPGITSGAHVSRPFGTGAGALNENFQADGKSKLLQRRGGNSRWRRWRCVVARGSFVGQRTPSSGWPVLFWFAALVRERARVVPAGLGSVLFGLPRM